MTARAGIRIEPWGPGDLPLLEKTMGDPAMTEHLGGAETPENAERQLKYERLAASGGGRMFKIVDVATGEAVGTVGYWDKRWRGEDVYETGWSVIPAFQGRGIAAAATALAIERAAADRKHRFVYAYPSVENAASNGICRKLGFELVEEREFEYPPGRRMLCNVWRLELPAP
ncbi:MAG: GNAT family N-acetyltransferase [Actinomycetota bacterium]|nr:GNAT family N-acetyltransferase [Actinomycetota bacterium]